MRPVGQFVAIDGAGLVREVGGQDVRHCLHAGHGGGAQGHGHFSVRIVSDKFSGMLPLARHRAIYAALGQMMTDDIHALAIDARAPEGSA